MKLKIKINLFIFELLKQSSYILDMFVRKFLRLETSFFLLNSFLRLIYCYNGHSELNFINMHPNTDTKHTHTHTFQ